MVAPIQSIIVGGFKSIAAARTIELRPLTLFAGANSSGKSSVMQPLLLWKQPLEATYDPGPLLLNGQNVKFTSFEQLRSAGRRVGEPVTIGLETGTRPATVAVDYVRDAEALTITQMRLQARGN